MSSQHPHIEVQKSQKKKERKQNKDKNKSTGHFSRNKSNDQESSNDQVADTTYSVLYNVCSMKIILTDSETIPYIQ